MRVIAGKFRSRVLSAPGKLRLRPTSDRLRETLFNILGPTVLDSLFLDLYAGTGAIGIEAISRGARETIFIENHPAAVRLLRKNLEGLGVSVGAEVIESAVLRGLERLATRRKLADFIFIDPPYKDTEEYSLALEFLDSSHLIAPSGIAIAEHSCKFDLPERFSRLERTRVVEQGDSALSFYRLAAAA